MNNTDTMTPSQLVEESGWALVEVRVWVPGTKPGVYYESLKLIDPELPTGEEFHKEELWQTVLQAIKKAP